MLDLLTWGVFFGGGVFLLQFFVFLVDLSASLFLGFIVFLGLVIDGERHGKVFNYFNFCLENVLPYELLTTFDLL